MQEGTDGSEIKTNAMFGANFLLQDGWKNLCLPGLLSDTGTEAGRDERAATWSRYSHSRRTTEEKGNVIKVRLVMQNNTVLNLMGSKCTLCEK